MMELQTKEIQTIPSYEIAKMMEVEHPKVLRMIEGDKTHIGIIPTLDKAQMGSISYFIKSSYKDTMNREKVCYECTKMGCDMLANKMTGEKRLYNKLREWNYICKTSTKPTQYAMERDYFVVETNTINTPYGTKQVFTTKATPKAQVHIVERLMKELNNKELSLIVEDDEVE